MPEASILIPAFNEAGSIERTIKEVRTAMGSSSIDHEIIVIDDGSTDGTGEMAASTGVRVISHPQNQGYGASLKSGIRKASGNLVAITDADGTYPVEMLPVLLERLRKGGSEMVIGARRGTTVKIPLVRRPFKWFLRKLASHIVQRPIPDLNSGLRAFTRKLACRYYHLYPEGFSFTSTITVASMCDGYPVEFVDIDYHKRTGTSKITPVDFFNFVSLVIRLSVLFKPLRVFLPVSFYCFLLGLVKLAHDIYISVNVASTTDTSLIMLPVVSASAVTLFISALLIFLVGMVAEALATQNASLENMGDGTS